MSQFITWIKLNWEKIFFRAIGTCAFVLAFLAFNLENSLLLTATAAVAFFSFFYASFSKFKRIKGLGIELERFEEARKEADSLIEQLREIISIYSSEVIRSRLLQFRMGGGRLVDEEWQQNWSLLKRISGEHGKLGHKVDLSEEYKLFKQLLIFDAAMPIYQKVHKATSDGRQAAGKIIADKYGSPVADPAGHNADHQRLRSFHVDFGEPFDYAHDFILGSELSAWFEKEREGLAREFGVEIVLDEETLADLAKVSALEAKPADEFTDEDVTLLEALKRKERR